MFHVFNDPDTQKSLTVNTVLEINKHKWDAALVYGLANLMGLQWPGCIARQRDRVTLKDFIKYSWFVQGSRCSDKTQSMYQTYKPGCTDRQICPDSPLTWSALTTDVVGLSRVKLFQLNRQNDNIFFTIFIIIITTNQHLKTYLDLITLYFN